jgi:hypothetical protein
MNIAANMAMAQQRRGELEQQANLHRQVRAARRVERAGEAEGAALVAPESARRAPLRWLGAGGGWRAAWSLGLRSSGPQGDMPLYQHR